MFFIFHTPEFQFYFEKTFFLLYYFVQERGSVGSAIEISFGAALFTRKAFFPPVPVRFQLRLWFSLTNSYLQRCQKRFQLNICVCGSSALVFEKEYFWDFFILKAFFTPLNPPPPYPPADAENHFPYIIGYLTLLPAMYVPRPYSPIHTPTTILNPPQPPPLSRSLLSLALISNPKVRSIFALDLYADLVYRWSMCDHCFDRLQSIDVYVYRERPRPARFSSRACPNPSIPSSS